MRNCIQFCILCGGDACGILGCYYTRSLGAANCPGTPFCHLVGKLVVRLYISLNFNVGNALGLHIFMCEMKRRRQRGKSIILFMMIDFL